MDVNLYDEVDAPMVSGLDAEADERHAAMPLSGRADVASCLGSITVSAVPATVPDVQALVDQILAQVEPVITAYNDLLTRVRQN